MKVYGGKFEMSSFVHYLLLTYFRGLRCFHLKDKLAEDFGGDLDTYLTNQDVILEKIAKNDENEPEFAINVEQIRKCFEYFLNFLLSQNNESLTKLVKLK